MRKLLLATLLLGMYSNAAHAEYQGELGYLYLDTDVSGVGFGAVYGTFDWAWEPNADYVGSVGFIGAYGVKDDSYLGVDVSLDTLFGVGYKGKIAINHDLNWYYRVMYVRADITSDLGAFKVIGHPKGAGFGLGLTYDRFSVGYIKYFGDLDNSNAITLGITF